MLIQKCNVCGKEFDGMDSYSQFGIKTTPHYGSKYDSDNIHLDLCCDCFDNLMDYIIPKCKLSPIKELEF